MLSRIFDNERALGLLLVAPVVQQGATQRTVYLPCGPTAWFDFYSGNRLLAGQSHRVEAPLSQLPLFARAGASIAMASGVAGRHRHDDPVNEIREFRDGPVGGSQQA